MLYEWMHNVVRLFNTCNLWHGLYTLNIGKLANWFSSWWPFVSYYSTYEYVLSHFIHLVSIPALLWYNFYFWMFVHAGHINFLCWLIHLPSSAISSRTCRSWWSHAWTRLGKLFYISCLVFYLQLWITMWRVLYCISYSVVNWKPHLGWQASEVWWRQCFWSMWDGRFVEKYPYHIHCNFPLFFFNFWSFCKSWELDSLLRL
jgi:hypothetical protein